MPAAPRKKKDPKKKPAAAGATKARAKTKTKTKAEAKAKTTAGPGSGPPKSYPKGVVVCVTACDLSKLKEMYGGKLPDIKSRTKRKYPAADDEKGWREFYAEALTYRNKERYCRLNNCPKPDFNKGKYSKSMYEYVLFHGRPHERKNRSLRNKHRREHGLKKGDTRQVHHLNPRDVENSRRVVITHCEHQRQHGKSCKEEK